MTNSSTIYITHDDHTKLRLLISSVSATRGSHALDQLRDELDRAVLIDPAAVPPGVVTLESQVEYEDVDTGEVQEYTITFPERANIDEKRISVLAPIGTALLGCRVGDVVRWDTPGGARSLRIRRTTPPAIATVPPSSMPTAVVGAP